MPSTLTISLDPALEDELKRLAADRRCASAELAAHAVADFVARERDTVAAIQLGLDDMAAGRVAPHDEVMAEIRGIIRTAADARRAAR